MKKSAGSFDGGSLNEGSSPTSLRSFCRTCQAFCGIVATIDGGRVARVKGDRDDPLSLGYACFKGLQAPDYHYGQSRLLQSLQLVEGAHRPISSSIALAAAGDRLAEIVALHGGAAVGLYMGTQSLFNTPVQPLMRAFAEALGTARLFATMTIDQSAKWIAEARLGAWHAGPQEFATADVWMMVGSNPAVSMVAAAGANHIAFSNPVKTLRAAKARSMRLIVIDPRRTETANFADLFLQPRPGTDALIATALLQMVLRENWHDKDFCRDYVDGVDEIRAALSPLSAERTECITGLASADVRRAARMFALEAKRGMVGTGTGTDMGPYSNLAEHLFQALNIVCGRFPKAGDFPAGQAVLTPSVPKFAQVHRPQREWESGPHTLTHSLGPIRGTMMSTAIADEILDKDSRRMRALICVGGNLALALPNAARTLSALEALELLIVIDPRMTATARAADFVFAPTLQYERADHSGSIERLFQTPFAHATPALVGPPEGSDVLDEDQILLSLAARLGVKLRLNNAELSLDPVPSRDTLLAELTRGAAVSLQSIADREGGFIPEISRTVVEARRNNQRFDLLAPDVAAEICGLHKWPGPHQTTDGSMTLIVRRHREVMNSTGTDASAIASRFLGNVAFMTQEDLTRLGLSLGDLVRIGRDGRFLRAYAGRDDGLRQGCVSIAHCWPNFEGDARGADATNVLVDDQSELQPINRMPVMTAMRVTVEKQHFDEPVGLPIA